MIRNHFLPKARKVEFIKDPLGFDSLDDVSPENNKFISSAFSKAKRAFSLKYASERSGSGYNLVVGGRRSYNLPVGIRNSLSLGSFIHALFRSECKGSTYANWLSQLDPSAIASNNVVVNDDTVNAARAMIGQPLLEKYVITAISEQPEVRDPKTGAVRQEAISIKQVWLDRFVQSIDNLMAVYGMITVDDGRSLIEDRSIATINFVYCLLSAQVFRVMGKFDLTAFVRLRNFVYYFILVFPMLSVGEATIQYKQIESFDLLEGLFEKVSSEKSILSAFKKWYKTKHFADFVTKEAMMLRLKGDALSKINIEDGFGQVPDDFYDELINMALSDTHAMSQESYDIFLGIKHLEENINSICRQNVILREETKKAILPSELDIFLYSVDNLSFGVTGFDIATMTNELQFESDTFRKTYDMFVQFVQECFVVNSVLPYEHLLPTVVVHDAPVDGKIRAYRFDFSNPTSKDFLCLRIQPFNKTNDIVPCGKFSLPSGINGVHHDQTQISVFKSQDNSIEYWGSDQVEEVFKKLLLNYVSRVTLIKKDANSWDYSTESVFLTILPPKEGVRQYEISLKDNVRLSDDLDYTIRAVEYDLDDISDISWLDLWFSAPYSQLADAVADTLKKVYESRLGLFGREGLTIPSYKYCDMPLVKATTPAYSTLLSIIGADDLIDNRITLYRPNFGGCNSSDILKASFSKMHRIKRFLSVKVPIPKTLINTLYLNRASNGCIFSSGVTRIKDGKSTSRFILTSKDYDNFRYKKESYEADVLYDLRRDVSWEGITEKYDEDDNIILYHRAKVPGFDSVDAGFNQTCALLSQDGVCVELNNVLNNYLIDDDILVSLYRCINNIFITSFENEDVDEFINSINEVINWIDNNMKISSASSMSELLRCASTLSYEDFREQINGIKTMQSVKILYEKLFARTAESVKVFSCQNFGTYSAVLTSSLRAELRIRDEGLKFKLYHPALSGNLFLDYAEVTSIISHFANRACEELLIEGEVK